MGQAAESRGWLRVFAFRRLAQLACMRQRAFSSGGGGPASLVLYDVQPLVLRDRPGWRVPRARVLQGAPSLSPRPCV